MNLPCLRPIPQCSFNLYSWRNTTPRFRLGSYSCFPPYSPSLRRKRSTFSFTISAGPRAIRSRKIPARDRVIDFGKYKGKMLGTLPSKYLKWVTKNLRARDFEEWAQLADEVLSDPVYNDRIEWEFAQNILNGDVPANNQNAVSELLEISTRFGWDNEDKLGWSKIDFEMLGTSNGGRIPRLSGSPNNSKTNGFNSIGDVGNESGVDSREQGEKDNRERRRERIRLQRRQNDSGSPSENSTMTERRGNSDNFRDHFVSVTPSRFPGRESLLKKALSLGTRKSLLV
ncbi:hypothetical protein HAX54_010925 [Datura stramonium]|uniref:Uncharacterized protein n=1 Tax=Datura stramonium TaxID=4076 RepID=A0ABS8RWS3_DATST|nr:hypothetical protein [Datura stramonium]